MHGHATARHGMHGDIPVPMRACVPQASGLRPSAQPRDLVEDGTAWHATACSCVPATGLHVLMIASAWRLTRCAAGPMPWHGAAWLHGGVAADLDYVDRAEAKEKSDVKKSPQMKLSATFITTFE